MEAKSTHEQVTAHAQAAGLSIGDYLKLLAELGPYIKEAGQVFKFVKRASAGQADAEDLPIPPAHGTLNLGWTPDATA